MKLLHVQDISNRKMFPSPIINIVELNIINPSKLRDIYKYFMSPSNNPLNDHQKHALSMRKVTYYFVFGPQEFN